MSSYIPGSGLKGPLNQLEAPVYPNIKKGPPRFIWSRKSWHVDTGETMKAVQDIPQMQENAVLFQSRDYNSQHAYGKFSSRTQSVNKEFRPPMQDRDDFLPLSRIPRPVVIPRINPGAAFSSGNSVFSQQNMNIPGVEKYITDRVKAGEIRPTFFAPTSTPVDNSILPDLELKLPPTSASAGFKFPNAGDTDLANDSNNFMQLNYNRSPVSVISSQNNYYRINAPDARENKELSYNRPSVSAVARRNAQNIEGFTPIEFDLEYNRPSVSVDSGTGSHAYSRIDNFEHDLEYNRPQISAISRQNHNITPGVTQIDFDLEYNRPQISTTSGFKMNPVYEGQTSVEQLFKETDKFDIQATGSKSTPTTAPIYNMGDRQIQNGALGVTDAKHNISYIVPRNTSFQSQNTVESDTPFYREKQNSLSGQHGSFSTQGHIRRAGLDMPQTLLKMKKGN